jgi:MoaA/NifB/PqqE/SkfB family radical SAM enzyme
MDIERRAELVQGNAYTDSFIDAWKNKFKVYRQNKAYLCKECSLCDEREFCCGESNHTWDYDKCSPIICMKKLLNS